MISFTNSLQSTECAYHTMHRSKGLEFDEVVLLLPRNINGSQAKKDNMKKLIYVAITRAKKLATVLRY